VSCWPAVISNQQLWQKSVVNALCSWRSYRTYIFLYI
jgi:hypothetical protein